MRLLTFVFLVFSSLNLCPKLTAQNNLGQLINGASYNQTIDMAEYHQYELNLKKGAVAILNFIEFDVAMEFTVVSPTGFIVEQTNNSQTADFLIFEATVDGKYQFYIHITDPEHVSGKYSLTAQFIKPNKNRLKQIKQLLEYFEKPNQAGTAIAIIENDKTIFEYYHGYADIENSTKNNGNTVFELASVSKQFTAMAIAKLAEEKKLSVEDDIRIYFPELPRYKTPIKVKHLLNHTSGIIDSEYPLALAGFEKDPIGINRVLNFLQNTPEQYFEPGSEFAYSNDGYTLLGELIERITAQSFKDWTKQHMFDPLQMKSTIVRDAPEIVIPNRAISYIGATNEDRLSFDFYAPGGCSIRSSIHDLIKWVNYLDQGYHSNEALFKRINKLEKLTNGDLAEYAYGNFISDFRGIKRISHLGLSAGFRTSIARFPDENLSFIYLGNDGEWRNYYLSQKIYEILLGQKVKSKTEKFESVKIVSKFEDKQVDNQDLVNTVNLSDYEGTYYASQIHTNYTLKVIQDSLYATSAAYEPILMRLVDKNTFETDKEFMTKIVFKRGYNQEISDYKVYNEGDNPTITFRKFQNKVRHNKEHRWYTKAYQQRMMDSLKNLEKKKILPGFVVSVFDESETIFNEGFGYANIKDKKAYTPETIQNVASITKTITGIALMKAMEMGYFKLDDAINDYLPFKIVNPNFPNEEITIRHLLTHTSSLQDVKNYNRGYVFSKSLDYKNWPETHYKGLSYYNNNKVMSLSEFLTAICSTTGQWYSESELYLKNKPGTNFEYSNTGFALLGYILELTTKKDYRDFTKEHIFDPLEMTSATWELNRQNPKHATYYLENYNESPDYTMNTIPEGGLYINSIDLTKYLQEAIKGYNGQGTILTQSSYKEMYRSQTELIEIEGGLGWDLSIGCCVGHAGNDFGVSTVMYFEPKTGIGRIVFSNISIETEELEGTFYGIMNLLFQ